ncbi:MAG TPA: hypothetical protein DD850_15635 [Erwinia persicina]|uniref:hypothetical protein n=1 Tax=Erwinia persicina TaxID=55211 RepID=UPI0007889902|nr:hypothetical protein [Erwinia persicina]AXU94034.1 hypothetical protein CI789_01555 [Erwinia persicina]MBC3946052.1 hypothetical protein [Erwinia persicina]MBD8168567.1 hypothetical protein [Erwinia persicina]MCQ4095822.1 hypothetical protein [Erwinia persicina]MCQ4102254.1 hypothetical protein [Erwinia persicina]
MRYEFTEVLNDLIDYFLLGDIRLLQKFKQDNGLGDDLAAEFISNTSADRAVESGIVIPLAGIENYPYTIIFSLSNDTPELLKPESRLQLRRGGYLLQVENRRVLLFTWRILQNFTDSEISLLQQLYDESGRPQIEVENGLYDVEILGGEVLRDGYYEPAFEFVFKKTTRTHTTPDVDSSYRFTLDSDTY